MSERKVVNKYIPPDYDPNKLVRGLRLPGTEKKKRVGTKQRSVRLMVPFSMRCNSCGEYLYRGTKLNARKETIYGEDYLGIETFRFYIRCTRCSDEILFRTDPKNADYKLEWGASRNFEPWRTGDSEVHVEDKIEYLQNEDEEPVEIDPMAALEAKATESKRELEILDALESIKARNARLDKVDVADPRVHEAVGKISRPVDALETEITREDDVALAEFRRAQAQLKGDTGVTGTDTPVTGTDIAATGTDTDTAATGVDTDKSQSATAAPGDPRDIDRSQPASSTKDTHPKLRLPSSDKMTFKKFSAVQQETAPSTKEEPSAAEADEAARPQRLPDGADELLAALPKGPPAKKRKADKAIKLGIKLK